MTLIKKNIAILIILSFISCRSQEIKISVKDKQNVENVKLKVFLLTKKDTLFVEEIKPDIYTFKESKNTFLIEYGSKKYLLKEVENNVKSIVVDYNSNADNGCFIVNKIFGDVIQSYNSKDLKDCSDVSNVYLYNTFESMTDNSPQIRIRKANNSKNPNGSDMR